jgi:putative Ca2+/H+ antiporter (TMEM165/GDT1 family)
MQFGYALLVTYWTVLVAELVSDKSIYTVASLSLRFRGGLMLGGMAAAFGAKMLAAVAFGQALVHAPLRLTASLSAITFFLAALFIWRRGRRSPSQRAMALSGWRGTALIPFASLFFTEWADLGQISAATLAAQFHLPLPVWVGGTLALLTKGMLAMALGQKLRDRIPRQALRLFGAISCCILGLLSLTESVFH